MFRLLAHAARRLAHDWFLLGMLCAVVLASLFPDVGRTGGLIHADQITDAGIALIFFLHGVGISFESLKAGLMRWPVHVAVQTFTFVVFPLLYYPFSALVSGLFPPGLMLGFLYLCVLPGTISSIVVYFSMRMGTSIITAASLSFLGMGAQPPTPEWGAMLNEARADMVNAPHVALFPSLAIFFTVLAFNLLGDGLRDALDPKIDRQ